MKIVIRRKTKKLRKLKFYCPRCQATFLADLYPDCTFEYNDVLISPTKDLVTSFVKIQTTCPDCCKIINYGKRIDLYNRNGVFIK